MTEMVLLMGVISLISLAVAMYGLARARRHLVDAHAKLFMALAIGLLMVVAVGNLLEHGYDSPWLDTIEGYTAAMSLPMLLFFAVSFRMHRELRATRDAAEREQRLSGELDHRVRNNLAAVLGLIDVTRRDGHVGDLSAFSQLLSTRVRAMSAAHNVLSEGHWRPVDLRRYCEQVMGSFVEASMAERVQIDGPDTTVSARIACGLALPLHELYRSVDGVDHPTSPVASLNWELVGEQVRLTWRTLVPAADALHDANKDLIRGFIEYELGGEVTFDVEAGVFTCAMMLPRLDTVSSSADEATRAA